MRPATTANVYNVYEDGKNEKQRPKVLASVEVKHAENGGHIVTHRFDNSGPGNGYHESEDYAFGSGQGKEMISHIAKQMGVK